MSAMLWRWEHNTTTMKLVRISKQSISEPERIVGW